LQKPPGKAYLQEGKEKNKKRRKHNTTPDQAIAHDGTRKEEQKEKQAQHQLCTP